ncbi:TetR/AcrR family transcriptional regulator [Streptomyces phaeolivaceus]|uniref:TetR/AcrR family transcriptional regulator n=1 Tax=Streptomyces phaeolivaceus TaxID=2653200 RepID=A0A5P8KEW6_9ACTN|nr:TetR/AcrR family transcriptional regulator [Streptomyces phaeolivaceus]QFR01557.1 TetR/AcrR family transcriptional regulator [Streptomyces phaeolivaceus]
MPKPHDDPRALRSRAAALAAAAQLLVEGGPERVTHAAVAERAGIGRATVYRHWPDVQSLLLDTLAADARPLLGLGDGPIREELITDLQRQIEWFNQPVSASVTAAVIERAARDEGVRRIRDEMFGRSDEHFVARLTAAVDRGELRPGAEENARELISHIIGPLLFQRFMLGVRLDTDMAVRTVDMALAPWLPDA